MWQLGTLGKEDFPWKCELDLCSHTSNMLVGSLHSVARKELLMKHQQAENRGRTTLSLSIYLILLLLTFPGYREASVRSVV